MRRKRKPAELLSLYGRERTCPVCGKTFILRCRPDEWGYWYNNSDSQLESKLTLFCSGPCSRAYARQKLEDEIRRVRKMRGWRVYEMYLAGYTQDQIQQALNLPRTAGVCGIIDQLLVNHGSAVEVLVEEVCENGDVRRSARL